MRTLDNVYTLPASSSATKGYLEELQAIANKSGKSFQEVLQEELRKISTQVWISLLRIKPHQRQTLNQNVITHRRAHQEAEEVQARPPVKQTSPILLGPVSPELVHNLPTMFPPSPSLRRSQLGSARAAQAVLTSADAQRVTVTAGNPPVMSPPTSLNYQMQPVAMTSIPSPCTATKSNTQHQVPLSSDT